MLDVISFLYGLVYLLLTGQKYQNSSVGLKGCPEQALSIALKRSASQSNGRHPCRLSCDFLNIKDDDLKKLLIAYVSKSESYRMYIFILG